MILDHAKGAVKSGRLTALFNSKVVKSKLLFKEARMLEILAMSGWGLLIISPFVLRAFFNWYDEKHKNEP